MTAFHIAQLNIGRARGAVDGPIMAEFMALLDPVNAVADASPGFVWRLQTEDGNATALRPYEDDRMIVNMSVWESIEDARGLRLPQRARRRHAPPARVVRADEALHGAWWVPAGAIPTVDEAKERLEHLRDQRADALRLHLQGALPVARRGRRGRRRRRPALPGLGAQRRQQLEAAPGRAQAVVDRDRREARVGQQRRHGALEVLAQPLGAVDALQAPTPPRA